MLTYRQIENNVQKPGPKRDTEREVGEAATSVPLSDTQKWQCADVVVHLRSLRFYLSWSLPN